MVLAQWHWTIATIDLQIQLLASNQEHNELVIVGCIRNRATNHVHANVICIDHRLSTVHTVTKLKLSCG